jgi:flagellar motor component MotA
MVDMINKGHLKFVLGKISYIEFICSFSNCSDTLKEKILSVFPDCKIGDLRREINRTAICILEHDVSLIQNDIVRMIPEYEKKYQKSDDVEQDYIDFHIRDKPLGLALQSCRQEIISSRVSLDYNGFLKTYYNILWLLYSCRNMTKSCGLIELENHMIEILDENDFICIGLKLIVSGNMDNNTKILTNNYERERDPYRKKLKEIALKGILTIYDGCGTPDELMLLLNDVAAIKDGYIDKACESYKDGDQDIFNELFRKGSVLYEKMRQDIEREEVTVTRRILKLKNKVCREGLESIKEVELDSELLLNNDIIECGVYLIAQDYTRDKIEESIDKIIESKKDSLRVDIYQAQKTAVLSIIDGDTSALFEMTLSYFADDIAAIIRKSLQDEDRI